MSRLHGETHVVDRIGWLRAAVLGANDGLISTASLMVGIASAATSPNEVIVAGVAGLVAGAMSMAAGEYVSVSSQADTEQADIARETHELAHQPEFERDELTRIYVDRGVEEGLARQVAEQLMQKDALGAHARDELGITATAAARPVEAALTSAATFAVGAMLPVATALILPSRLTAIGIPLVTLVCLAVLGALGARLGGAAIVRPTLRVAFWGALAMATTAAIGAVIGRAI
ncbi:MAG: VIT family protein [Phreatobacter sp.]|nr:VIT family protein [Phreatobacter sp.]